MVQQKSKELKTLKIVLAVITFFVIVFFSTGLIVKETTYTVQIDVKKPINQVFEAFNNIENKQKWIPEIQSVEVVNENIGKMGSEYQLLIENEGQKILISEKVMAYIPNEKLTLFYNAQNLLKTNEYIFKEVNGLTNIVLIATCSSDSYIMACLFPYFKSTFKNQDLGYLTNFKAFVEQ